MIFFTQLFTSKRGPLAKIWLAAHWERKLTKDHIFECNLETTVRDMISPKMKLCLRTSGHLLVGVVRIYSRKAKYLLADCNDAMVKIKMAFRPGQTDLPEEGLEATLKAITLIEDFTAFDVQLPHPSNIDVVDHFSLNQCRSEEITLKEDFGNGFLNLADLGDKCQSHQVGLLDMSFQLFAQHGDDFGDEHRGLDLLDFLTISNDPAESADFVLEELDNKISEASTLNHHHGDAVSSGDGVTPEVATPPANQTTLLANDEEAFALEPVTVTPNSEKKRGKRRRKLVVDQAKELTNECIRRQLLDDSDLLAPLDMAPPTVQLMQWKESSGASNLLAAPQPCSNVAAPPIKKLFARSVFQVKPHAAREEAEVMRRDGRGFETGLSTLTADSLSVLDSSMDPDRTRNTVMADLGHTDEDHMEDYSERAHHKNSSELTHPELPSGDSMFVHPSCVQQETQSTPLHTQSMLDSQDFEERRITTRTQKLLDIIKSQSSSDTTFSLEAHCKGEVRSHAATTLFCLLLLKKQEAIHLHQSSPYEDIVATPGPNLYN
ncbi:double-strand-break repair protein rad21-like protein 1 [Gasterosteus aculeatus]